MTGSFTLIKGIHVKVSGGVTKKLYGSDRGSHFSCFARGAFLFG